MKLPDFIIVGTMKSGTTTLGHYLGQHQKIYMPKDEVHYFDARGGYKDRWDKGISWYQEQFIYANEDQLVGEKTPTYCYLEEVPERIYELLPEVKLIWIFRNPVDRAYSNYWHAVRNGGEKESFEYAVRHEKERIKKNIWHGYLERSNYITQVENYLNYFNLDQMLFLKFEDLKSNLTGTVKKSCNFLGIEFESRMIESKETKNKTFLPKYQWLRYLFTDTFGSRSLLSKIERKINVTKNSYPEMNSELRSELLKRFEKPNTELSKLTKLNLVEWNR